MNGYTLLIFYSRIDWHLYVYTFFHVALQSFRTMAASRIGGFLNYFRHMVGLLGRVISPSHGLYLHRTTQHRKTRTNIHASSGIRTHDLSNQLAKTHASDRTATVTGMYKLTPYISQLGRLVSSKFCSYG
jgi:hypothetical protein